MPWFTPSLKQTRSLTRDYVLSQLGARSMIPNSVLRIMSDAMAGLAHLALLYLDWLSKQLLPDTAEQEWLDRHGVIWLTNADGSKGRKAATYAQGTIQFQGNPMIVPIGTVLIGSNAVQYQTITQADIGSSGFGTSEAVALTAGSVGNLPDGDAMSLQPTIPGITDATLLGDMSGGVDQETDDQLRERILFRIQNPPMGGSQADYVAWAMAVPGVTRAWAAVEQGIGTITVRFLMDDLRASNDGWPTPADVQTVADYIDTKRPVTVKDCYVLAPIKQFIDITIAHLEPDTVDMQAEIEGAVKAMLLKKAAPGQTIYSAWVSYAIMNSPNIASFNLITTADYVMPSLGHMAVLETILYT